MYERILLPTDGSPGMAKAIEQCLSQARLAEATVHVLYVVDLRAYYMLPDETQAQVVDLLESEGRDAVEWVAELADAAEVDVVTSIEHGVPDEVILDYAEAHDIDLVVMGTHGRTGEERRVLGSIAEEVVRNSMAPVLTVRMSHDEVVAVREADEGERPRYIE